MIGSDAKLSTSANELKMVCSVDFSKMLINGKTMAMMCIVSKRFRQEL